MLPNKSWVIRSSRCLICCIFIMYAAATFALWTVPIFWLFRLLCIGLLLLDGFRTLYFQVFQGSLKNSAWLEYKNNQWQGRHPFETKNNIYVLLNVLVWAHLVVIRFRQQGKWLSRSIVIFSDAFNSPQDFRSLKNYLRFTLVNGHSSGSQYGVV